MLMNPWKVLGVHRKSTDDDIREAYLKLAKKYHPDTGAHGDDFAKVSTAYHAIRDKKMRAALVKSIVGSETCGVCRGNGCTSKSKSLTSKVYTICELCDGAGFIIHKEKKDAAIVRGTTGTGRKGRDKKR